jgi:hypothetical protein
MFVTQHAYLRMSTRLGPIHADALERTLSALPGEQGTIAYILADLPVPMWADDGSNGDILVGIAYDGSIETLYLRRSTQDMRAAFFGARRVVDLRR